MHDDQAVITNYKQAGQADVNQLKTRWLPKGIKLQILFCSYLVIGTFFFLK